MLGKFMGILDIMTAIIIMLSQYLDLPFKIVFMFAMYMIIKAVIFFGDFMSFLDGMAGLYMILMIIFKIEVVSIFFALYLFFKGVWSML